MNYIDIIILVPIIFFGYKGFKNGVIKEAASLVALILGIYCALKFSGFTSEIIIDKIGWNSEYLHIISFALTFIVVVIAVHFIARLADKLAKAVALGLLVRIFGALFGVAKIIVIMSVLLMIINKLSNNSVGIIPKDLKEGSLLYEPVAGIIPKFFPVIGSFEIPEIPGVEDAEDVML